MNSTPAMTETRVQIVSGDLTVGTITLYHDIALDEVAAAALAAKGITAFRVGGHEFTVAEVAEWWA